MVTVAAVLYILGCIRMWLYLDLMSSILESQNMAISSVTRWMGIVFWPVFTLLYLFHRKEVTTDDQ